MAKTGRKVDQKHTTGQSQVKTVLIFLGWLICFICCVPALLALLTLLIKWLTNHPITGMGMFWLVYFCVGLIIVIVATLIKSSDSTKCDKKPDEDGLVCDEHPIDEVKPETENAAIPKRNYDPDRQRQWVYIIDVKKDDVAETAVLTDDEEYMTYMAFMPPEEYVPSLEECLASEEGKRKWQETNIPEKNSEKTSRSEPKSSWFDTKQERCEKAYAEGVEQARRGGLLSEFMHGAEEIVIPDFVKTDQARSEDAGYRDYMKGKVR